jgi:uncharacterized repeat protein (TIGR03803 family)
MKKTGQHQRRIAATRWLRASGAPAAAIFVLAALGIPPAQAQTYKILLNFPASASGGENPYYGSLIRDTAGNLYGTTNGGGGANYGVVFELHTTGKEKVLHSFGGFADGANPVAGVIFDSAGNLYGTTYFGGASGQGVVFKLDTTRTETVLYSFTGGADGGSPRSSLIRDSAGNLYGTTEYGGASGQGTVFKLDAAGTESVLYSFRGRADGATPVAGLVRDSAGNLYGTTYNGGASGFGVVFKVNTAGKETVLHSFAGGADGANPYAGLIRDSAGNFYGTTFYGGASNYGIVFKVDTTRTETVLYSFTGGADGGNPSAGVIRDSAGNLYGATTIGGAPGMGYGVVFELDTAGTETVLHTFAGGAGGANPVGGLIRDSAGNLYGTTQDGGSSGNDGLVFEITP